MNVNYKFVDATFDAIEKVSTVTINTDIGKFVGIAKLHPDDDNIHLSQYFGFEIAEMRAVAKYCMAKAKYYKHEVRVLKEYLARMATSRNFKETDFYVKQLHLMMDNKDLKAREWLAQAMKCEAIVERKKGTTK